MTCSWKEIAEQRSERIQELAEESLSLQDNLNEAHCEMSFLRSKVMSIDVERSDAYDAYMHLQNAAMKLLDNVVCRHPEGLLSNGEFAWECPFMQELADAIGYIYVPDREIVSDEEI